MLLSDGGVAHLRPIRPSDADRLVAFYDRVSPESKYLRFFAPYPRLSDRDVKRFTEVDYVDRVAFIITLGDDMIAVGRYDRIEDDHAEVAFLIEDAHQGRGIAQLLLEHLAQAAREREITRFVAEVLPANRRMAKVFADAGYRVSKGIEDGVLAVEFPILPTDTSVGVMERREHRAESASVRRLLTPERIVVYGNGDRTQGLIDSMLRGGFRGEVAAVAHRWSRGCGHQQCVIDRRAPGSAGLGTRVGADQPTRSCGHRCGAQGSARHCGADRDGLRRRGQPPDHQPGARVRYPSARSRCSGSDQHAADGATERHTGTDAAGRGSGVVLPIGRRRGGAC